jgi:hypothetical protein
MQKKHRPFFSNGFKPYKWLETLLLIAYKKACFSAVFGPFETN